MKVASFINALLLVFLGLILCVSYYEEYINHSAPCPLCILQRFFIASCGITLMFNVHGYYCIKSLAASLLSCLCGSLIALYQWSQLLINDGVTHAPTFFGVPMYVWSAMLFFYISLALFLMIFFMPKKAEINPNLFAKAAYSLFLILLLFSVGSTFYVCGLFIC